MLDSRLLDKEDEMKALATGVFLYLVIWLAVVIGVIYAAFHFITKYW